MEGGSDGLEFATAKIDPSFRTVLVHDPPDRMRVDVSLNGADLVGSGTDLSGGDGPMVRLRWEGLVVLAEPIWPAEEDLGTPVILPGGEVGTLLRWETSTSRRSWTWQVEFRGGEPA
jgi:hypothetical protein